MRRKKLTARQIHDRRRRWVASEIAAGRPVYVYLLVHPNDGVAFGGGWELSKADAEKGARTEVYYGGERSRVVRARIDPPPSAGPRSRLPKVST